MSSAQVVRRGQGGGGGQQQVGGAGESGRRDLSKLWCCTVISLMQPIAVACDHKYGVQDCSPHLFSSKPSMSVSSWLSVLRLPPLLSQLVRLPPERG